MTTAAETSTTTSKLSLPALTAMVVGSMVGAGVFQLPARFASQTGVSGALIAWANMLGRSDCASVLQQNLDEEKATDGKLNTMALRSVNRKAA